MRILIIIITAFLLCYSCGVKSDPKYEAKNSYNEKIKNNLDKSVMKVFDVNNSVNSKSSYGGTSTKNIKKMISKLKKEFK